MKVSHGLMGGAALCLLLGACGGKNFTANETEDRTGGPKRDTQQVEDESVFGEGGFSFNTFRDGSLLGGRSDARGGSLPVNKFLWQASLDTLSFLPLSSTDPFTGVIATDWGSTPDAPGERFKVTAFVVNPNLAASSLRVAVYRERRNEGGLWVPMAVDPSTAVKLEDAILVRARQIRVASVEQDTTG